MRAYTWCFELKQGRQDLLDLKITKWLISINISLLISNLPKNKYMYFV